ncbi:hypothetical protein GCM10027568_17320 [Humibacter soli]
MNEDPRLAAARYRLDKTNEANGGEPEGTAQGGGASSGGTSALHRAAYVETAIQQAIRRGEFDDLPGAGKPLRGLSRPYDPDWWIRRKIETEKLGGLGPPALTLRVEDAELDDRLDRLHREGDVRAAVDDFNRRVIEARRQLLGGPPVVTPTRDLEVEVSAWRQRREQRLSVELERRATEAAEKPRRRWRRRG